MTSTIQRLTAAFAGRYRFEAELGADGMATAYLAHDLKRDRDVTSKVLHPDLGAALGGERFLSDSEATAKLKHPHILPLLDSGEATESADPHGAKRPVDLAEKSVLRWRFIGVRSGGARRHSVFSAALAGRDADASRAGGMPERELPTQLNVMWRTATSRNPEFAAQHTANARLSRQLPTITARAHGKTRIHVPLEGNSTLEGDNAMDTRPVLVVGASGQLGTRIVHRLVAEGRPVRAMVRSTSVVSHLQKPGVELMTADLMRPETLDAACRGARAVIATASAVAPTHHSTFEAVDDRGYAALLESCVRQQCGRLVLISASVTAHDAAVPLFRTKRLIEQRLAASGLEYAILRAGPFMDDWFALIGSALPARGDDAPLIRRRWPFLQRFVGLTGQLIDRHGIALVPGNAATRHAFIAIDDVAAALIAAVEHPALRNATRDLAGPEMLSWGQVAELFAEVLGRPVRVLGIPGGVFRVQQLLMQPFSVAASNIMGLNWLASTTLPVAADGTLALLGVTPITARRFLLEKAAQAPTTHASTGNA